MCERFPGFLIGGSPVSSLEQSSGFTLDTFRGRYFGGGAARWGSMSEGGGVAGAGGDNSRTNLIVNYLPQSMTEKDLYAMFVSVGPIESCRVMKDYKTGYSYGFGFVNFTREEDAITAINTFNGYAVQNKRLKVSYARPSGDDIKETNLYVTNLPRAVTEQQLDTIFGKYGRIVQKHILRDKSSGTPRGVAFVRFDKREEAQEAISALNNVIPEGGTEPLSVKVAEEHGKQKAAYYAGWAAGFQHTRGDNTWGYSGFPGMAGDPMCPIYPQLSPPIGLPNQGSHPSTPRNNFPTRLQDNSHRSSGPGCLTSRNVGYPGFLSGKGNPRHNRGGRAAPWGTYAPLEERYKANRYRNVPSAYW